MVGKRRHTIISTLQLFPNCKGNELVNKPINETKTRLITYLTACSPPVLFPLKYTVTKQAEFQCL